MQISVHHQPQEILVQSVTLKKNEDDPLNTYIFHCPYCRNNINQIQGVVGRLDAGYIPDDNIPAISQCRNCGMKFTFTTSHSKYVKTEVTLTAYQNKSNIFSCYISRTPMLKFTEHEIMMLNHISPMSLPFEIRCSDPSCRAHYKIIELI